MVAIVGVYNLRAKKAPLSGNFGAQEQTQKRQTPTQKDLQQDEQTIANFMGDENYPVIFISSQAPSNFTVGSSEPLPGGGGSHITTPQEWQRTVNIYESTKFVSDSCEVYRFEVFPKTHEMVNVGLVYPKGQATCDDSRSALFSPPISTEQIKTISERYLEHALPKMYSSIKDNFTAQPVSKDNENDRWEWLYEDKEYKTPAELEAEPKYPTIRIFISNSGNLLQYENSLPLFKK
ncbi:MAG: hypothetical protein Q7S04_01315 [Candidatus Moranbacteria bacterium]|nr:hypothetical protein [Candidatus Moranbacteria bacterium]